jgi:hypothetical protein
MSLASRPSRWTLLGAAALTLGACGRKADKAPGAAASGVASAAPSVFKPAAPVASGLPGAAERVSKAVNPENLSVYTGPTGGVRGVVTASGDQAPVAQAHLDKMKAHLEKHKDACPEGREMYGRLFREGMMRSLADVLVAVTGYDAYLPEKEPKQVVSARGCAFSTRTIALTYGQTIEVVSKDRDAYVPNLLGSNQKIQLLALPRGAGSVLYPPDIGHYLLTDDIKVFMLADVYVVKYSTHDVTSLDGRYEILGIPPGKVRLNALLPSTGVVTERVIDIKAGQVLEVPLEIGFDTKAYEHQKLEAAAMASAVAKAKPGAPSSAAAPPLGSAAPGKN